MQATTTYGIADDRAPRNQKSTAGSNARNRRLALVVFGLLIFSLALVGPRKIIEYAFPAGCLGVASWLYFSSPPTYIRFVLWLFFLAPLVRRIADWHGGWTDRSLILAAPFVAALACTPCLFRAGPLWREKIALPLSVALACVAYGSVIGLIFLQIFGLLSEALTWGSPIIFSIFLLAEFQSGDYEHAKAAIINTFVWGTIIMGSYGIAQFALAPAWDRLWMIQADMGVIGSPEPFEIRVFSTMNSPGPLALALCAGIFLAFRAKSLPGILAQAVGCATLVLSMVRSGWVAWAVTATIMLFSRTDRRRLSAVLSLIIAALVTASAFEPVQQRLATFTNLKDDTSFQQRSYGYTQMAGYIMDTPFGMGLGAMDMKFSGVTDIGTRDSGLLELLLSLGWFGTAAYLAAYLLLAWQLVNPQTARTPFEATTGAISIGIFSQLPAGSVMVGWGGVLIWGFAAISLGSLNRRKAARESSMQPLLAEHHRGEKTQ